MAAMTATQLVSWLVLGSLVLALAVMAWIGPDLDDLFDDPDDESGLA